jgi:oxygen-dependent protoporphyrinogen oxidase
MGGGERRPRIAVVGAGMAGLACARALLVSRPDLLVTVYEGSAVPGGKLALGEVAGHRVDLGAESMLSRRPEATQLARDVGLGDRVVHPAVSGAGVWTRGRVRSLPASVMGIPVDLPAAASTGVLSRAAVARAAREPTLPRLELAEDVGVGALVTERLGRDVRDRLVEPLLGGVYAGRSDEISLYAALPQLVSPIREHGGLLAAASAVAAGPGTGATAPAEASEPVFAGLAGGVGGLPAAVAADITRRGGVVLVGARVRELGREASTWRLVIGSAAAPSVEAADIVVLATPAPPTARLLRDLAPVAARLLSAVEYASVAIITFAWRAQDLPRDLHGTGFLVPPVDGRLVKAATFSSQKWHWQRGDTALIRCSVGRHRDEAALQRGDDELVEAATRELNEALGLPAPPIDAGVTRWGGGLPQYAVGHLERMATVRAAVDAVPGLEVCGAAYEGVGVPAVIAGGQQAATRVLAALGPTVTMAP